MNFFLLHGIFSGVIANWRCNMIDSRLIESIKLGDEGAFETLYSLYKDKIYRTCWLITKDSCAAEDVLQEVFIKVYQKINKLKEPEAFQAWVYKITINCCIKHIKKYKASCAIVADDSFNEISEVNPCYMPEDSLMKNEFNKRVMKLISELPLEKKTTVILYYFNDLSIKEIAKVMNCFEGTVKSRLHNSKKILGNKIIASNNIGEEGMTYEYR